MGTEEKKSSFKANPSELDGCPDMSSLIYMEEENVLYNLKIRFDRKSVYTAVTKILISTNPYQWMPLYSDEIISRYEKNFLLESPDTSFDPHCYYVSASAFNDMNIDGNSQSLVVCGESGSGKTESAKALMSFLAKSKNAKGLSKNLSDAVLAVNPILEAFGNAKTVMNNNSSRFGKFTKMIFTDYDIKDKENTSRLVGSVIDSYLLEKSRVIMQNYGERNFHVFFQIFKGLSADEKYGFTDETDFFYLSQTDSHKEFHTVSGQDDLKNFEEMKEALGKVNVSEEVIESVFKAVASILHVGNINFEEEGKGVGIVEESQKHLEKIHELLEIDKDLLLKRLTQKKFLIMKEVVESPFTLDEAFDNRNSFAKSLYQEIFFWLIKKCNKELLMVKDYKKLRFIGILDVFGFERFERNSFEQFCINFANERLQQLFSESLLLSEQKEYLKEGIVWTPLKIPDNRSIMKLVNGKTTGIFPQLEAACNMPKGSPTVFVSSVFKNNASNKRIAKVKQSKELIATLKKGEKFNGFRIRHYADTVIYNCNEFLSKNTDRVSSELFEMFSTSNMSNMKEMFPVLKDDKNKNKTSRTNIGYVFSRELDGLIKTLKSTSNYFVRCVNPNKNKSSTEFDESHVRKQLRSGGLVQSLKVIKLGYPTRAKYDDLKQYRDKIKTPAILEGLNEKDYWAGILAAFNIEEGKYQFGLTKLFFKPNINFISEVKNFDGNLTDEMVQKIRNLFVGRRLTIVKGLLFSFVRIRKIVTDKKLTKSLTNALFVFAAFSRSLSDVKERIRKEEEEKEKERLRKEQEIKEQEEKERLIEEQKLAAEEEAREQEALLEEKNKKIMEERLKSQEEQKKKLAEIKATESLMQQKAQDNLKKFDENREVKIEEIKKEIKRTRDEEDESQKKKRGVFDEQFEKEKKLKKEEIEKLEEKIMNLREETEAIMEKSSKEKEERIIKQKEFEASIKDRLADEREAMMRKIMNESSEKTEEMSDKLNEYEADKKAEIDALYKENEKRLSERKEQIDVYEKESKERLKKFNEDNIKQFEEMKEITSSSQSQMKSFIEDKLREIEQSSEKIDDRKKELEKGYVTKMEDLSFEKQKFMSEIETMKEMAENEISFKREELENEKKNTEELEKIFKEQLEELHKKRHSLKAKERKGSRGSKDFKRKIQKLNTSIDEECERLKSLDMIIKEGLKNDSKILSLKIETRKENYQKKKNETESSIKEKLKSTIELAKTLKGFRKDKKTDSIIKILSDVQSKVGGIFSTEEGYIEGLFQMEKELNKSKEILLSN